FDTLQQGISFYENYARVSGFETRLYSTKKRKSDGKISLKYCVCNKEGFRETPRLQSNSKKKRPITRMGCNARITLKLINDQDNYIIFSFHEGHTHPLTTPNSAHHSKQSRNLTLAHKKYIMDNSRANIGATKSYRLMKEHVGGYHNMAASNELLAACFNCGLQSMIPDENIQIVTLVDHKRNSKIHTVRHHLENNSAECSCKMYEREGIPCRHILWVMKEKGLKSLPAAYIKTRWTKAAMNMPMFDLGGNLIEDTTNMEAVKKKVGHLWSEIFTCVSMAENNEDCFDDFMKLIDGFKQSLLSRGNLQASGDKGKQMETLLDCP
ncbi:Protein FAR1-RELATED SEQUENCE 5, partial [Bienertia sinuspersici]